MSKLPPPPKVIEAKTPSELARIMGISRQLISYHKANSKDAPSNLNVDAWRLFLSARGREESSPESIQMQMAKAKLSVIKTKAEEAKLDLRKAKGELIDFVDAARFFRELIGVDVSGEIDRMAFEMPPNLVGLNAAQMFIELKKEKEKMKATLKSKVETWIEGWERKQRE